MVKELQTLYCRNYLVSIEALLRNTQHLLKILNFTNLSAISLFSIFIISLSSLPFADANHIVSLPFSQYNLNDGEPGVSEVIITVTNATADTTSNQDTVTVTVTSTTDPIGVSLVLTETSVNSGIFENTNLLFTTGIAKYKITDTVTVSIVDNSINNPLTIDTTSVNVSSVSGGSLTLTLTETGLDTAIFEGTLAFTSGSSSGNSLSVVNGDVISIKYLPTSEIAHGLIIPNPNSGINTIATAPGDTITVSYFGDSDTATMVTTGPGSGSGGPVRPSLVVDSTGQGGGCPSDCTPPTLGVIASGIRYVENGFSYNENPIDVELFYTPYPLITVEVGQPNVAKLKIFENNGIQNIQHIALGFGLGKGEIISESKAVIEYHIEFDGTTKIDVFDPNKSLDSVLVESTPVKCKENDLVANCLEVSFHHTFRESLEFNMVGTNIWDQKRNGWQNYFNDGIEIIGDSLNPPKQVQVLDRLGYSKIITLTDRKSGFDNDGNTWYFDGQFWLAEYKLPIRDDPVTMHGIDRNNNKFIEYRNQEIIKAQNIFNEIIGKKSIHNYEFGLNKNFPIVYEYKSRADDKKLQQQILEERITAEKSFKLRWPEILINFKN